MNIKNLKNYLACLSRKDIEKLSQDNAVLNRKQTDIAVGVCYYLSGKQELTDKELNSFMGEALVWFVLELLRRENLVRIDNKGVAHKTKLGIQVDKYMAKQNK